MKCVNTDSSSSAGLALTGFSCTSRVSCAYRGASARAGHGAWRGRLQRVLLGGALALTSGGALQADAFDSLGDLDQNAFRQLSEHLGAASHYKGVTPAEPLGIIGFDVGVGLSSTPIDESLFDTASSGDFGAPSLFVPRVSAHKGLPFGIDIGAFAGVVPKSDLRLLGAEVRYAILEGGVATPAVAVRASYSKGLGLDALDIDNAGLELTVSKGFVMFTPYGGVGFVHSNVSPDDSDPDVAALSDESFQQEKLFVGVNVNLVGLNLTVEADRTGSHTSYSGKIGLRF